MEIILANADKIGGKQGEKIAAWGDKLRLAKQLTTICLDVPIEFRPEDLTRCEPHIDALRALFAELDFKMFLNDIANLAPPEPESDVPQQEAQRQLAEMARAKSAAAKKAALAGQGNLFEAFEAPQPAVGEAKTVSFKVSVPPVTQRTTWKNFGMTSTGKVPPAPATWMIIMITAAALPTSLKEVVRV